LSEETLTPCERFAINELGRSMLNSWDNGELTCDFADFLRMLNAGAARSVRMVKEVGLSGKPPPNIVA
jgi:hypothetical protein